MFVGKKKCLNITTGFTLLEREISENMFAVVYDVKYRFLDFIPDTNTSKSALSFLYAPLRVIINLINPQNSLLSDLGAYNV